MGYFPGGTIYAVYAIRIFQDGRCICSSHRGDTMNLIIHNQNLQNNGLNAVHNYQVYYKCNIIDYCNTYSITRYLIANQLFAQTSLSDDLIK